MSDVVAFSLYKRSEKDCPTVMLHLRGEMADITVVYKSSDQGLSYAPRMVASTGSKVLGGNGES